MTFQEAFDLWMNPVSSVGWVGNDAEVVRAFVDRYIQNHGSVSSYGNPFTNAQTASSDVSKILVALDKKYRVLLGNPTKVELHCIGSFYTGDCSLKICNEVRQIVYPESGIYGTIFIWWLGQRINNQLFHNGDLFFDPTKSPDVAGDEAEAKPVNFFSCTMSSSNRISVPKTMLADLSIKAGTKVKITIEKE